MCMCVFARIRISYLDIERVPFPPRGSSSSEERQEGEGVEGQVEGGRVRIPPHPPAAGTPRAPTRRRAALYGRKGVSCMRAARRAAYR